MVDAMDSTGTQGMTNYVTPEGVEFATHSSIAFASKIGAASILLRIIFSFVTI